MVENTSFPPTHCVENWLQSGISLGKTHYHLTEQWLTPGCACSWMDLALPIIHLVTTLRCLKIFQALQYKCQTFYYFYTPLHCKVHLTVFRVFLLGDPCWPFAPEQQNCEKCWISLYWKTTIACSSCEIRKSSSLCFETCSWTQNEELLWLLSNFLLTTFCVKISTKHQQTGYDDTRYK
jgi:hypothetical protein